MLLISDIIVIQEVRDSTAVVATGPYTSCPTNFSAAAMSLLPSMHAFVPILM
jgi:hypothetical protein